MPYIYKGGGSFFATPILTVKNGSVFAGTSSSGKDPILSIKGNEIRTGWGGWGSNVLATVRDGTIYRRSGMFGEALASYDGEFVYDCGMFRQVIARVENGGCMEAAAAAVFILLM